MKAQIKAKLTQTLVDSLKPKLTEYAVWDTSCNAFAVRVRENGTKTYTVRMLVDGKQKWLGIGRHGKPWNAETARTEAERLLGQAASVRALRATGAAPSGVLHPVEARGQNRVAVLVPDFARRYFKDYATGHKGAATVAGDRSVAGLGLQKDGTEKPVTKVPAKSIVRWFADVRMDRLTSADVSAYHLMLGAKTKTRANRALALLSHMCSMAEIWGVRAKFSNPCKGIKRYAEPKRERYLSTEELARVGAMLAQAQKWTDVSAYGLDALRLLMLTGARASEILKLKWADLDLKAGSVRILRKKEGQMTLMTLHLPEPAVDILNALERVPGNPYAIVGKKPGTHYTLFGLEQLWQDIRIKAKVRDVRIHDLRHTFASAAAGRGEGLPVIGAILGHTRPETTARYVHLIANTVGAAAGGTGKAIARALSPKVKRGTKRAAVKVAAKRSRR